MKLTAFGAVRELLLGIVVCNGCVDALIRGTCMINLYVAYLSAELGED